MEEKSLQKEIKNLREALAKQVGRNDVQETIIHCLEVKLNKANKETEELKLQIRVVSSGWTKLDSLLCLRSKLLRLRVLRVLLPRSLATVLEPALTQPDDSRRGGRI